jgi:hypothetical protein
MVEEDPPDGLEIHQEEHRKQRGYVELEGSGYALVADDMSVHGSGDTA